MWAFSQAFKPSKDANQIIEMSEYQFFEIYSWLNFTFSSLFFIMNILIIIVIMWKVSRIFKYIQLNGVFEGNSRLGLFIVNYVDYFMIAALISFLGFLLYEFILAPLIVVFATFTDYYA